ncbi:MAG: ACP S-malonyltransferase [Myxococcales bacterium]|nr:ACP S-malonyltransferase [Myxococcales bacterium]
MGKVAFLFPGQGAQKVGMGKAAFDESAAARAVFEEADAALGESLSGLCFEGPDDALQLTANTQPAILTTSVALLRGLDQGCHVTAGHSLGEYSANVCAGTLAFADAVKLVRQRGQYMQQAVPVGVGAMAAVLGGDVAAVEAACAETEGAVEPVNYNCPGQLVIAGAKEAVEAAGARIKEAGAKVRPLPVSAPFHSSLMQPAEDNLRPHLEQVSFSDPSVPVYVNVDAAPVIAADAARDALVRQVSRAVRWEQTIRRMLEDGVTLFVEIGPGKVLTGMLRRIDKGAAKANVENPADFEAARAAIAEHRDSQSQPLD